jgi:3-hydroxyisobutyrate dehydrogenase-like beta-hydroxyacid dehydrogenase
MNDFIPRAGVVGLRTNGGAIARSLAWHGIPLAVYDDCHRASGSLQNVPASLGSPHAVAARSDVVIIADVDAAGSERLLVGTDGLLVDVFPGLIVVLACNVSPKDVHHLTDICRSHDAALLDAGVRRGEGPTASDGLVITVGGECSDVIQAMPVLDRSAWSVIHCGPLGSGLAASMAHRTAANDCCTLTAETTTLATLGCLAPEEFLSRPRQEWRSTW